MHDPDATPLIPPASPALLAPLAFPASEYGARFVDLAFWRPYVELIAGTHGLPGGEIAMGEPGTFPTFILGRSRVVKLFGAPFDGLRCCAVERAVADLLANAGLAIPIPAVIAAGVLSRDPDWRYLVTAFIPGEPFAAAGPHLDAAARRDVAGALGRVMRPVHDLPIPPGTALGTGWSDWAAFVEDQRRGAAERHRRWGSLPERLLAQVDGYVAGYRVPAALPPSLVHADLHDHHLIGAAGGAGWAIRGLIDWGDARLGDRFYELPALHLGLFHGDRAMLRAFLETYGWPDHRSDAFVRRAMTMTLLHEFNVLDGVGSLVDVDTIASLDDLADALWRA
jgi:hypothetical protein